MNEYLEINIYTNNIDNYTKEEFIKFLKQSQVEIKSEEKILSNLQDINEKVEIDYILTKICNVKDKVLRGIIQIQVEDFCYKKIVNEKNKNKKIWDKKEYIFGKDKDKVLADKNKKIKIKANIDKVENEVIANLFITFILVKCKGVMIDLKDNSVYVDKPYQEALKRLTLSIIRVKKEI